MYLDDLITNHQNKMFSRRKFIIISFLVDGAEIYTSMPTSQVSFKVIPRLRRLECFLAIVLVFLSVLFSLINFCCNYYHKS